MDMDILLRKKGIFQELSRTLSAQHFPLVGAGADIPLKSYLFIYIYVCVCVYKYFSLKSVASLT